MTIIFLIISALYSTSYGLFNTQNIKEITIKINESYFGYSLLLQSGSPPRVIVGAPKGTPANKNIGSVYQCNIHNGVCQKYNLYGNEGRVSLNRNGDFLGVTLDGDSFAGGKVFTCAPRFTTIYDSRNYYVRGKCFYVINSTDLDRDAVAFVPLQPYKPVNFLHMSGSYYESAFGEAGLALKYVKASNEILTGAPGMIDWNGALVKSQVFPVSRVTGYFLNNDLTHRYSYFGYSVSAGRFKSPLVWYVAGAPREFDLKGQVIIFETLPDHGKIYIQEELIGEELGSYFGATLMVAPKTDGDDLFVGAPMYSGQSYDEGCVYYYENDKNGHFRAPLKLFGRKKKAGRFGAVIADMGDLELNGDHYIAISAPYEDDGIGAVYIYKKVPLSYVEYQRISPSDFTITTTTSVKRFGLGISNAKDIDGNFHSDVAIGAYGSNQVFILYYDDILDMDLSITTDDTTLNRTTSQFSIKCCISLQARNKLKKSSNLNVELLMQDGRIITSKNMTKIITVNWVEPYCEVHVVKLMINLHNFDPIKIIMRSKLLTKQNYHKKSLDIPFSLGCGADNKCQTDLSVHATMLKTNDLVVGRHKELDINVAVLNQGEPAYNVELIMNVSNGVSLVNLRQCTSKQNGYVCPFTNYLPDAKTETKIFILDVRNLDIDVRNLRVSLFVSSLGHDDNMNNNRFELEIPVKLESNPYINGKSIPEGIISVNNEGAPVEHDTFFHTFNVGNSGPSPLDLKLVVLVPNVFYEGTQLFKLGRLEGTIGNMVIDCQESNETVPSLAKYPTIPLNSTLVINCFEKTKNCRQISCTGGYFYKTSETASFTVEIEGRIKLLSKLYQNELILPDTITFVTSAILSNGSHSLESSSFTPIYILPMSRSISWWVYLLAVISASLLLGLLVFTLYKCNFFKREYKDKLLAEQYLMEEEEADDE